MSSALAQPASLSLMGLIVLLQLALTLKRIPAKSVGYNYKSVVEGRQVWRAGCSPLCHNSDGPVWKGMIYAILNAAALLCSALMEAKIGSVKYLKGMYVFVVVSTAGVMFLSHALCKLAQVVRADRRLRAMRRQIRSQWYVCGLSSAICGILAALSIAEPDLEMGGDLKLPSVMILVGYVALSVWVMPRANMAPNILALGSGLLFGQDLLDWFLEDYFIVSMVCWSLVAFIVTLKLTTRLSIPCIYIEQNDQWTDIRERPVRTELVEGYV
mmetsp:Transcript_23496/g.41571  ORF Transcript_23496/g.41571 Transcript_23496/m.41571 type:complete len:270 (-) Transcript_23496:652-1461(-)